MSPGAVLGLVRRVHTGRGQDAALHLGPHRTVAAVVARVVPQLFVGVEIVARENVARQRLVAFRRRAGAIERHVRSVARLTGLADPVRSYLCLVGHARGQRPAAADALEADVRHLLRQSRRGDQSGGERQRLDPLICHSVSRQSRSVLYRPRLPFHLGPTQILWNYAVALVAATALSATGARRRRAGGAERAARARASAARPAPAARFPPAWAAGLRKAKGPLVAEQALLGARLSSCPQPLVRRPFGLRACSDGRDSHPSR